MPSHSKNNVRMLGDEGHPLLLVHGFGCDQNMWRFVTPLVQDTNRVILVDLVGAGGSDVSEWSETDYSSLQAHAHDMIEVARSSGLGKVAFVGHSVSAMIGVLAANIAPELFSHLIMVCPSPRYLNDTDYTGGFSPEQIEEMLSLLEQNPLGWSMAMAPAIIGDPNRPDLGQELAESFCRTDPKILKHFGRVTFTGDNRDDLKHVDLPTLIIECREDFVAPRTVGKYVHDSIRGSKLVTLDTIGHCPNLSAPIETGNAIIKFMNASP